MDMQSKVIYAFRGWIGFVAFMDLGTAAKSFIEKKSFLSKSILENEYNDDEFTTARMLGMFALLKALVLIYSTLYIHYKPVVNLGRCSLAVTILLYFNETFYFKAATIAGVIFPWVVNILTLLGLIYLPNHLKIWDTRLDGEEENAQLLKQAAAVKRKRNLKKAS